MSRVEWREWTGEVMVMGFNDGQCGCCECRGILCHIPHPGHSHLDMMRAVLPPAADALAILKKIVIAWDADQDEEHDEALDEARALLGFKVRARCRQHDDIDCDICNAGKPDSRKAPI